MENEQNKEIDNQSISCNENIKLLNESLDNIKADMQAEQQTKRKRGRPRKTEIEGIAAPGGTPMPTPGLWTPENSAALAKLPFLTAEVITGSKVWEIDEEQTQAIALPLSAVLNEYGAIFGKYASIISLSTTLIILFSKKYNDYKEEQKAKNDKKES